MLKKLRDYLANIFKGSDSGIKQSQIAKEKLLEASEEIGRKTDLSEVTGGFDETTKPMEFKEGKPIIDQEGETQTRVFSYRPESFTDTQKRTGVGSFSDEALRERYFDEGFDDTMSLEEFIIKERGITPEERAAELRDKGKIQKIEPAPKGATFEEADDAMKKLSMPPDEFNKMLGPKSPSLMTAADDVTKLGEDKIAFITNIAKTTGREPKAIRQMIVDKMNEGYEIGDPKRVTIRDDAKIQAYIETQRQMDDMGFLTDIIEEARELPTTSITGNPMLDRQLLSEQKLIDEAAGSSQAKINEAQEKGMAIMEMLKELGINTGGINAEIFKINIPSSFAPGVKALEKEVKKLEELFERTMPAVKSTDPENFKKLMTSINEQASADQALAEQLMEDIVMRAQMRQLTREEAMAELNKVKEKFDKIPEARKEGLRSGNYISPFGTEGRTLNAKGGRIGFSNGGFSGTLTGNRDSYMLQGGKDFNGFSLSGNLMGNFDSSDSQMYNLTARKEMGPFGITGTYNSMADDVFYDYDAQLRLLDNLDLLLGYGSDDSLSGSLRYTFDKGGRVGFNEGGGPKINRRNFLQLAGAGLASFFMPRAGKEIAEVVTKTAAKTPVTAEGMPIWFPSLVDKIRKEGKMIPADYKATKQGEGYDFYEFQHPNLPNKKIYMTEYKGDGTIEISGRGDDMQITELRFIPGQENIRMGEGTSKVSKDMNTFEADEFMKGPGEGIGDYEGGGTYDDLKFGVESWASIVKSPEQKLLEESKKFKETQTNPNPNVSGKNPETGEEFATGGRVGYNMGGGVETLFRRRAS